MKKVIEASVVSPDMKVGQYNILKDIEVIDDNIESTYSLSETQGKGKIYINGSKMGSRVTCVDSEGNPALGVAGCLRNYLQVQNNAVSLNLQKGYLYTDMQPYDVLSFIKDLGMFSGFREDKRIDEASAPTKNWKDEFIQENSYINTKEYKRLLKDWQDARNEHEATWKKYKAADEWLRKHGKPKPKSEWTSKDSIDAFVGDKPMVYKEKEQKKADEYKSTKATYLKKSIDLDKKISKLNTEMEQMKLNARKIEIKQFHFGKPKHATRKEYEGFSMKTNIPYYDERLEQGKGYIAEMEPKEYILRCAFQVFPEGTIESTVMCCDDSKIKKFASKMKSGEKFDMPYLNLTQGEQEGRHRAVAAMIAGIKLIPVYIY